MAALAIVPLVWGRNNFAVWMLFIAPLLGGGSGAVIRPMVDRLRRAGTVTSTILATLVLGLVAGGISGVLFVTAQLAGAPSWQPQLSWRPTHSGRSHLQWGSDS